MNNSQNPITITLPTNEAVILSELLHRFSKTNILTIEHQAEERVLWNIEAELETKLDDIMSPDWHSIVQEAREEVADKTE